ncbi:MAG: tRNA uridine-5-carboxymethylaminomethyl(34) synthesis GTPase MnmE [Bacilli bacterium]|nr:tRNA uridine-5-carboxymethylaminomethyl(34) synthesis GTPase MnmE [Bacilli bacterium]
MNENICAISTALGVGAISIIRASGPDVINIVNEICDIDLSSKTSHTISYAHILNNKEVIDEVLIMLMKAPKTFTKEDVIEINSHGGISTTNKILELLLTHGCRLAEPGEFTKKAYLNGRIDLLEAEGINDLIVAETEKSRKLAMNRVEGNLSKLIKKHRKELVSLQAELEVIFDYPDEIEEEISYDKILDGLNNIKNDLDKLVDSYSSSQIIKDGIDVALVGKPNVGKSSILNHLLNEDKAIVTNIAGTTRDIVEGSITLNGIKINLIDTAGIRETDDVVEKIGVDKSKDIINKANLVIFILDNNTELTNDEKELLDSLNDVKKIIFINKNDLDQKIDISNIKEEIVYGNTTTPEGLDNLKNKIIELFNLNELDSNNYNYLTNARELSLVKQAVEHITDAIKNTKDELPFEIIADDIKVTYELLGEVIGETYTEDLLDEIFTKFCVGK